VRRRREAQQFQESLRIIVHRKATSFEDIMATTVSQPSVNSKTMSSPQTKKIAIKSEGESLSIACHPFGFASLEFAHISIATSRCRL